jgi:hypothetical protein
MGFWNQQRTVTILFHLTATTNAFVRIPRFLHPSQMESGRRASPLRRAGNPVNFPYSTDKPSPSREVFTMEEEEDDDELELWTQKQSLDAMMMMMTTMITTTQVQEAESSVMTWDNNPELVPIRQESDPNTDVWKARLLLILAAALYGTNFSFVKVLGDVMPVSISAALRFGLASFITLPWLFQGPSKDSSSTRGAILAGFEVGIWNSIGYLSQALGLATTAAGKVRMNGRIHDMIVIPFLFPLSFKIVVFFFRVPLFALWL